MPVSFKVVDNRTNFSKKIREMEQQLDSYRTYFLQEMAGYIVLNSPVDTGTYITSHNVGTTITGGFTSSYGKPTNQPYQPYANEAIDKLFGQIEGISDDLGSVRFTNIAEHADKVEYEHGYAVYTSARREANNISARAASRAKAT